MLDGPNPPPPSQNMEALGLAVLDKEEPPKEVTTKPGIKVGFRNGFDYSCQSCGSTAANMLQGNTLTNREPISSQGR